MKRKLNLFFATSLLLSSSMSILALTIDISNITNNNNIKININTATATKYANETSIVGKSLLIGKDKGFNTNNLLNNMYGKNKTPDISNLTGNNTGNDFINDWTNKLDGTSINNIQSLFQRNGTNQPTIDKITNNIENYSSYDNSLPTIKNYLNNTTLASDSVINIIDSVLKNVKTLVPNIDDYLSYTKYIPIITRTVKELLTDWPQQDKFSGNTPLEKMQDYMSKNATFAQAWNIPKHEQWYYVKSRAESWNWNQFYQYIAGVNFNYMFKLVSGKYIGEMITDNIKYTIGVPSGFNSDNFNNTFSVILDKILTNTDAWPYLIKAIVPILKTEVLKLDNPTLGVDSITWDKSFGNNNTVELKQVLTTFQKLISSKTDLLKLVTNLMTGPFGEDIITKTTVAWTDSYWTLPEIQSTFSWISAIHDIPQQVVNTLEAKIKNIPINDYINKILDFTNKYLTTNPLIDLKDLSTYLDLTFGSKEFVTALNDVKYIIDNPKTDISKTKKMLTLLGVQFKGETTFKDGSVFSSLSNWLNTSNSSLNALINIIIGKEGQSGILDNMLKEQKDLYQDMYLKYFDMDNSIYFILSNIEMNTFNHDNGSVSAVLSYQIKDTLNHKTYDVTFKNDNYLNSKDFKITFFHVNI